MNKAYRILDANLNRVSEGIRVIEDVARYYYNNAPLAEKLKLLRHNVRKNTSLHFGQCIFARDSQNDVGLDLSKKLDIDAKSNIKELVTANFKRVQEGLRTIEDTLKVVGEGTASRTFEGYRYNSYDLEKQFLMRMAAADRAGRLDTDIYCITAEEYSNGRDNIEVVRQMLSSGIKVIQYREKEKSMLEKYRQCLKIRDMTAASGATFIVNDHIDIGLAVEADGVHLGQDDIPVEKAREITGGKMIIGLSTHSPQQAQDAVTRGADYIGVGPLFKTFTKKDVCEPVGLEYLDYVVENISIPFVAIGGVKLGNIGMVKERGAKCISLVTEIVGAENIPEMIENIRRVLKGEEKNEL